MLSVKVHLNVKLSTDSHAPPHKHRHRRNKTGYSTLFKGICTDYWTSHCKYSPICCVTVTMTGRLVNQSINQSITKSSIAHHKYVLLLVATMPTQQQEARSDVLLKIFIYATEKCATE